MRSFYLPKQIYNELTGNTVKGWSDLVGILFQPLSEAEHDLFWDDDYERGSFKVWLKKKYICPYIYGGTIEYPGIARQDVEELLEQFKMIEVTESFSDYMERTDQEENAEIRIIKMAPLIDLTLEEMNASIIIDVVTESLLERLEVNKVIAAQDEDISSEKLFPKFYQVD